MGGEGGVEGTGEGGVGWSVYQQGAAIVLVFPCVVVSTFFIAIGFVRFFAVFSGTAVAAPPHRGRWLWPRLMLLPQRRQHLWAAGATLAAAPARAAGGSAGYCRHYRRRGGLGVQRCVPATAPGTGSMGPTDPPPPHHFQQNGALARVRGGLGRENPPPRPVRRRSPASWPAGQLGTTGAGAARWQPPSRPGPRAAPTPGGSCRPGRQQPGQV